MRLRGYGTSLLFTDEGRFHLFESGGHTRVWKRQCERFAHHCSFERNSHGRGSVHVRGGIKYLHRTPLHVSTELMTATSHGDQVIRPIVNPPFRALTAFKYSSRIILAHALHVLQWGYCGNTCLIWCIGNHIHQTYPQSNSFGMRLGGTNITTSKLGLCTCLSVRFRWPTLIFMQNES